MINNVEINITKNGAVILGPDVVCDGYHYEKHFRIQSHLHQDHMEDFESSKGEQDILMSPESYDLLKLMKNADIPYRGNIKPIQYGKQIKLGESKGILYSSGHMLGAVQTKVILSNGIEIGYSGDFSWPLEKIIKVDMLVVDSTYGKPNYVRNYNQEDVHQSLIELISEKIKHHSIKLMAFRGTLQHALHILSTSNLEIPILADNDTFKETQLYQKYGFYIPLLYHLESDEGKDIKKKCKYIFICNPNKNNPSIRDDNVITISLSNFSNSKEPILKYSELNYKVGMTEHADFEDTISYIEKTGATIVITDNCRGPHGVDLAQEIKERLNIVALPSNNI